MLLKPHIKTVLLSIAMALSAWILSPNVVAEASGPDFFKAVDSRADGLLRLRAGPEEDAEVTGAIRSGDTVRNLGCEGEGDARWCRVGSLADESADGWVQSRYLTEAQPPAAPGVGKSLADGDDSGNPSVYQRGTGEFEVNFKGGCGALFDPKGHRITAGSSCSEAQLKMAEQAVAAFQD
ncbi:SH3 domain-containing protein [Parahaliea maris]|uniref:SH3 domain-containing protein n=1 Tax=Parahaliea maris TaxID=2716870 RepID=A0A5C8ZSP6_9GAMM|nr:SH3 domain-containing protein [Parahaliea maris]TXS90779.1 SH3 domain-containing protein [Parahaliea maris]